MNAVGNVAPARLVEICEAVWHGDLHRGRKLHESLLRAERGRLLRHQPHPGQVHDEADRAARRQRAPAADGAGDRGTRAATRRCSQARGTAQGGRRLKLLNFRRRRARLLRRARAARESSIWASACQEKRNDVISLLRAGRIDAAKAPLAALRRATTRPMR